jgi:polyphosphate kinase
MRCVNGNALVQRRSSSGEGDSSASSSSDSIVLLGSGSPAASSSSSPTPSAALGRFASHRHHTTSAAGARYFLAAGGTAAEADAAAASAAAAAKTTAVSAAAAKAVRRSRAAPVRATPEPLSSRLCPYREEMHYAPYVDVRRLSSKELSESEEIFSRDFADLAFNVRVLSLALDPETPPLDRYKFCCIVSANLDEHFVKRLGPIEKADPHDFRTSSLRLLRHVRPRTDHEDKLDRAIRAVVADQHACLTRDILPQLAEYGIRILAYAELAIHERQRVEDHFRQYILPALTPLVIDITHPFPRLASHLVYICADVRNPDATDVGMTNTWRVFFKVPAGPMRLIPTDDSGIRFIPVELVVEAHLDVLCRGMHIVSTNFFRVTRNIKMSLEDADFVDGMDLMETVQRENHRRRSAPPTRLETPNGFPRDLQALLLRELGLDENDVFVIDGPLLDLASAMDLAFVPLPQLRIIAKAPQVPRRFRGIGDTLGADPGAMFRVIREDDVLIEHPRDSFEASTLLFLAAAARDPKVRSIKQVVYRAGSKSPLIDALVRAVKNGKEVTVLVELKASFDEVQNCEYANRLQRAGCNVMYGLLGLKVHSKIILVVREEEDGLLRSYANVSTGNFNPKTAKLYTDIAIMTCNEDICADMHEVFNALSGCSMVTEFRAALVAPVNMVDRFTELIRNEAQSAKAGLPSRIVCQVNGLSDVFIIKELYDASQAGVPIDLFVRGACRLRPGLPGLSDNIRVFSWVGPVLQHRRIYYYYANGEEKYYIGSADWRTRNLNERTEVVIPLYNERIKRRLSKILTNMNDHQHLWQLQSDGRYYKGSETSECLSIIVSPAQAVETVAANSRLAEFRIANGDNKLANALEPSSQVEIGANASRLHGKGKTRDASVPFGNGALMAGGVGSLDGPDEPGRSGKHRNRYTVNIKGNESVVEKIAAGAVPVRYDDPTDISTLRVLVVRRSAIDDPWSVPKGGVVEGESPLEAAMRITRDKAGVYNSEHVGTLGWILRKKRHKTIAISTFILRVLELGNVSSVLHERSRKWVTFPEAIDLAIGSSNSFTIDALERAYQLFQVKFAEALRACKDDPNGDDIVKDDGVDTSEGVRDRPSQTEDEPPGPNGPLQSASGTHMQSSGNSLPVSKEEDEYAAQNHQMQSERLANMDSRGNFDLSSNAEDESVVQNAPVFAESTSDSLSAAHFYRAPSAEIDSAAPSGLLLTEQMSNVHFGSNIVQDEFESREEEGSELPLGLNLSPEPNELESDSPNAVENSSTMSEGERDLQGK